MTTITEGCAAPAARGWRLPAWWAEMKARSACRASLAELPDHLRKDVGFDGGLPLDRHENGGRTFVSDGRPDSTLSSWFW